MEGQQLKKNFSYKFDKTLCIICQKQKDTEITSPANGQTQVRKAADIYQDIVWDRLKSVDKDFFNHVDNLCYKSYTYPKNLKKAKVGVSYILHFQYRPSCDWLFIVYL